jgi:hypothetical protein
LYVYQNTTFYDVMLTSASVASTSEVWTSDILEWLKGIKEHGMEGALNNTISTKFNRNLLLISSTVMVMKDIETGWRTDKYNGNLVSVAFLFLSDVV